MKRPSHATIVAYLALFTALSGSAYAAATIGSAQIKNNSIHSRDVRNNTLTSRDINERALRTSPRLYVKSASGVVGPGISVPDVRVLCDPGDLVVSGTAGSGGPAIRVAGERPLPKFAGWEAGFERTAPGSPGERPGVIAVCARKAPR